MNRHWQHPVRDKLVHSSIVWTHENTALTNRNRQCCSCSCCAWTSHKGQYIFYFFVIQIQTISAGHCHSMRPLSQHDTTATCSSRLCTLTIGRLQKPRMWQSLLTLSSAAEQRHEGLAGRVSCGPSHPACLGVGVASPATSLPEAWLFNREIRRGSCITWAEHRGLWGTRPPPLTRDATAADHYVTSSIHDEGCHCGRPLCYIIHPWYWRYLTAWDRQTFYITSPPRGRGKATDLIVSEITKRPTLNYHSKVGQSHSSASEEALPRATPHSNSSARSVFKQQHLEFSTLHHRPCDHMTGNSPSPESQDQSARHCEHHRWTVTKSL